MSIDYKWASAVMEQLKGCQAENARLREEAAAMRSGMLEMERLASKSKRQHYGCDDSWYSCPMSDGGCSNPTWDKSDCTCGASDYNETLDAIAAIIRGMLERLK